MTTLTATTTTVNVRQSREWTLAERVIASYLNKQEGVDAVHVTDTTAAIIYTSHAYDDGNYTPAEHAGRCYDSEELREGYAPLIAFAVNDFCQANNFSEVLIAINTDDDRELLVIRQSR